MLPDGGDLKCIPEIRSLTREDKQLPWVGARWRGRGGVRYIVPGLGGRENGHCSNRQAMWAESWACHQFARECWGILISSLGPSVLPICSLIFLPASIIYGLGKRENESRSRHEVSSAFIPPPQNELGSCDLTGAFQSGLSVASCVKAPVRSFSLQPETGMSASACR